MNPSRSISSVGPELAVGDASETGPVARLLRAQGFVVLDGGLATELERQGAALTDALWSAALLVDHPDLIRDTHAHYFRAGADVAITASYQASVAGFATRGLDAPAARILMARSVTLAAEARAQVLAEEPTRDLLVAGSIGPIGAARADGSEYRGDYHVTPTMAADLHGPRVEALVAAGADLLVLETFPRVDEAIWVLDLLPAGSCAVVCVTSRDGSHTGSGEPVGPALEPVAKDPKVAAVGVNCVRPDHVTTLLEHIGAVTDKPLVA